MGFVGLCQRDGAEVWGMCPAECLAVEAEAECALEETIDSRMLP